MYNTVSVRSQDIVVPGVMTLTVLAPRDGGRQRARGQFYMLKSWREQDPFLMRPISIDHIDVQAGTLTFLYKVVGRGTELLSHLRGGDTLELLGPLGKGFPIDGQLPLGSGHRPGYRHCAAAPAGGAAPRPGHGGLCLSQRQE